MRQETQAPAVFTMRSASTTAIIHHVSKQCMRELDQTNVLGV
jgi:hypothetical protein